MDLRNKKVTVVGLGSSGISSALLLEEEGAIVSATDSSDSAAVRKNAALLEKKYIETEVGRHTESLLSGTELLVVSPGVTDDSPPVRYAFENNIPVISELELGYYFCKGKIIAVTGTNGKSTVVSLLGGIMKASGKPFNVCGNIGNAFTGEVKKITNETLVILEVSSFQLERIEFFRPLVSVILNIAADHMDRYGSLKGYEDAKKRIFKNQRENDIAVLNHESPWSEGPKPPCRTLYFSSGNKVEGLYDAGGEITLSLRDKRKKIFNLRDLGLKAGYNKENILAATLVSLLVGAETGAIKEGIKGFKPLAHRFETVREIGGVTFINDSKATNVDSARSALESLDKRCVLIAGGRDKALPYEKIIPFLKKRVKTVVVIGEAREKIKKAIKNTVPSVECGSLEEAVGEGYRLAGRDECVLLSPMCSSFDMFRDYKERGEAFKGAVMRLKDRA